MQPPSIRTPEELVVVFSMDTWADAVKRNMARPPDRLLQSLFRSEWLRSLLVANPPRSAAITLVKAMAGRGGPAMPGLPNGRTKLVQPLAIRRRDSPVTARGVARAYSRYDRTLKRAADKLGMKRPPVITFSPLVAAYCELEWSGNIVYYARDDWASHPSFKQWWWAYDEAYRRIRSRPVKVVAVTSGLLERICPNGNGLVVPNGVDPAEWETVPPSPREAPLPRPLFAYVGTLDSRLDPEALSAVCDRYPGSSLVLAGPLRSSAELSSLLGRPGVHHIRPDDRETIISLLHSADVCLLPHRRTRLTEVMSPLKLYEYLAAGRPVAATNLPGVRRVHHKVLLGPTGSGFVEAVSAALDTGPMDEPERRRFVAENSWEARHSLILGGLTDW